MRKSLVDELRDCSKMYHANSLYYRLMAAKKFGLAKKIYDKYNLGAMRASNDDFIVAFEFALRANNNA
jgi:hypothetical protein